MLARSTFLAGSVALLAAGPDLLPVRVGVPPTDATAEPFYGVDQGFYRDAGLDVTLTPMVNGGGLTAALAAGSLDVIAATVVPTAEAFQRGIDLRVIAPGLVYEKGQGQSVVVVVAASSPIKTAADLNGKTVSVNGLGDMTQLALLAWLGSNGADLKSVKMLEVPFPAVGAALEAGRVDAALLVEPFTTALKGKVRVIGDTMPDVGPHFIGTVFVSRLSWLNANRDAGKRFAAATLKIGAWANSHNADTAVILSKHTRLPLATINAITRAVYGTTPPTGALLQPILDSATKYFGNPKLNGNQLIWSPS